MPSPPLCRLLRLRPVSLRTPFTPLEEKAVCDSNTAPRLPSNNLATGWVELPVRLPAATGLAVAPRAVVTEGFPHRDRVGGNARGVLTPTSLTLVDDCLPTGLGRRRSGRGCLLCHRPISRDDGFGLSEGICAVCAPRVTTVRRSLTRETIQHVLSRLTARRTRTASQPNAPAGVHDTSAEEIRAA
jgi:hypothetical protein